MQIGKSTLFNALTNSSLAAAENYPFCTIEPNKAKVPVPDPRLHQLGAVAESQKIIEAQLEFVDIAGLVKGASEVACANFCGLDYMPVSSVCGCYGSDSESDLHFSFLIYSFTRRHTFQGSGLGNKFLDNIARTSLILHAIRCFEGTRCREISARDGLPKL